MKRRERLESAQLLMLPVEVRDLGHKGDGKCRGSQMRKAWVMHGDWPALQDDGGVALCRAVCSLATTAE
jgi:hypothetical protein